MNSKKSSRARAECRKSPLFCLTLKVPLPDSQGSPQGSLLKVPSLNVGSYYYSIDYPEALNTYALDTNNMGEVVGYYEDSADRYRGFIATPVVPEPASLLLLGSGLAALIGLKGRWNK
jgi:hypothetical protein